MMQQQPSTGGGASMMDQQQQHQPQPTTTTTSTAQEEEEEEEVEEFRTFWTENLQNWMDKVEEKEVRTLWIGDLQHWMDEAYIDSCFSHTGEVFTSKVIRNKKTTTGESKCYGFIEFKSPAIAESFLKKFNGTPMPGVVAAAGTNFSLNWASSSSSLGSGEDDDDDLAAAAAASDTVTKNFMLPQHPFPSLEPLDLNHLASVKMSNETVISSWDDVLKWRRIAQGTRTPQEVYDVHRVYVIGAFLKIHYGLFKEEVVSPEITIQEMLDELLRCADTIDIAKELHSMDALKPLMYKFHAQDDGIQEKTIKIINTMATKYPNSRQLVMETDDEECLYQVYLSDSNPTVVTKALDAISSLLHNNEPGIALFRASGCFKLLSNGMNTDWVDFVEFQRRTLNLIHCLLRESNSECNIVTKFGHHHNMMHLASSHDARVREAALRCLDVLTRVKEENSAQLVKNDDKLKYVLQDQMEGISAMALEDLGAVTVEIKLLDSLWNACYNNKPSPLREKGLLV